MFKPNLILESNFRKTFSLETKEQVKILNFLPHADRDKKNHIFHQYKIARKVVSIS